MQMFHIKPLQTTDEESHMTPGPHDARPTHTHYICLSPIEGAYLHTQPTSLGSLQIILTATDIISFMHANIVK